MEPPEDSMSYDEGFRDGVRFACQIIRRCVDKKTHMNKHTRRVVNVAYETLANVMEEHVCQLSTNTKASNTPNS